MLTRGGYPFYRCKTIWEVTNATQEGEGEESYPAEYGNIDPRGLQAETGVCDCPQCCTQEQKAKA